MTDLTPRPINLASQPFRNERAQNAVYAAACLVLLCSFIVLTVLALREHGRAAIERRDIQAENAQLQKLRQKQSQYSGVLSRPQNADVFAMSVFLNELIARRGVSWTRVFEDLRTVLPNNVRLEVIRLPQVPSQQAGGTNKVHLDMVVGTDKPEAVVELLKHLEESALFGSATLVSQTPPTQNDPLYKYRVTVSYAQKL
jgi:Tfp pilus assembly protein PilN